MQSQSDNEYGIQVYNASINPAPRCPCVLLLDTSHSMSGEPIAELNEGVKTYFEEIRQDDFSRFSVETAVIAFGASDQGVSLVMPFTSCARVEEVQPPRFKAGGLTPMGQALERGLDLLKKRKREYRAKGIAYYQPWMVLMTDGAPTDQWREAAQNVQNEARNRKLVFLGVGVGPYVDMPTLTEICPDNRPPKRLQGLRFCQFFEWLSQSMAAVSRSSVGEQSVRLPNIDGWACVEA